MKIKIIFFKAKSFGKICVNNLNENLNVVRGTIDNYFKVRHSFYNILMFHT